MQPTVLDILDAVIADRRNLSGQWIADGIAEYRRAPLQPQTGTQPAQADNPHAQPQKRQNDAPQSYTQDEILEIIAGYERMYNMTTLEFSRKYLVMPDTYETNDWRILAGALGILPTPADAEDPAEDAHGAVVSVTDGEGVNTAVNPDNDTLDWLSDMTDADSVSVVSGLQPHPVSGREKRLSRLRQAPADTSPKGTGAGGVKWVDGELDKVLTLSKERQKVWRWLKGLTVTPSEPSCWDAAAETGISQQTANKAIKQYRDFHGIF